MRRTGAPSGSLGLFPVRDSWIIKPLCEFFINIFKTDSWEVAVCILLIPALRRQTADLCEFEANLVYEVSSRIPELLHRETLS